MFSYEFCEISKNTVSTEHLWTTASAYSCAYDEVHSIKGFEMKKKWKGNTKNKEITLQRLRALTGQPQVTLFSQLLNYFKFFNETSKIPQILSGICLKQEKHDNGVLGVDDVVIFRIWLIFTELFFP